MLLPKFKNTMDSNATLLTFLTISEASEEKVFFAFLKELDELAPICKYWYQGKGADGEASFLWEDKNIRQWCVIGKDDEIKSYWDEIISQNQLNINWNSKKRRFTLPEIERKNQKDNIYKIPGLDACGHSDISDEYVCQSWNVDISFLLNEQNNCEFLSGNKHNEKIKQIEPFGLFHEKFLFQKLSERICAVRDQRVVFRSLQGLRNNVSEDPIEYIGFIQADKLFKETHKVMIRDLKGEKILGEGDISIDTGKWNVKLSDPVYKGQFILVDKNSNEFSCGEKFYLLKNISFDTHVVHTTLKDLYKRDINITGREKLPTITDAIIWDASSAPTTDQSEIELSDKITDILVSLGKKIVFNDPYFFGDFKFEDGQLVISKNQAIFINALIIAIAKSGVEEINILGSWRKAKNKINGDKTELIKKYEALYQNIKSMFLNSSLFRLKKFNVCFSEQVFHDRYWLNCSGETIYHVSNSISGIYSSHELTVVPLKDLEVFKIKPRILERLTNSEINTVIV